MNSTDKEGRRSTDTAGHAAEGPAVDQPVHDVNDRTVADLVKIFKLLADPTRLQILLTLSERGDTHVRAICDLLDQNQPAVSHHLALLRDAGMIDARRSGKHNFYRICQGRIQELFDDIFADTPEDERSIRLAGYVLRYHPPQSAVPSSHTTRTDATHQPTPPRR